MNEVRISGRLTRDLDVKATAQGTVANFSIAHNYAQKGSYGKVDFFDVVAWRDLADKIATEFKKGEYIEITGYLKQQAWTNRDGEKRSKVVVVATETSPGKWNDVEKGKVHQAAPAKCPGDDDDVPF
ncbi:MAG TPA: single-stranded DNA-binding protein [Syntrophales bacterium]|nr:single-stranded DNA-binding protein [Syntrophales bacterium]